MKAIIYCRVSSEKQVREGHGLEGQEQRCREYAACKGYEVIKVFKDAGVSGSLTNRPAMQSLIHYLKENTFVEVVVIFDDIKRLARNIEGHFELKTMLMAQGARLESPSHRFEESPEGKLVETIFAAVAEHERNSNKVQVYNRMKARLQLGFWPFCAPQGYKFQNHTLEGKMIAPLEPYASIIKEALEGYASGTLNNQEEVRKFLLEKRFPHNGKTIYLEQVKRILKQPLYAGIIDYPKWDVKPLVGRHTPIISIETFQAVQDKLLGRKKQPFVRVTDHEDFPLRGFIICPVCEKPYTGSWSKGRNKKYPYYRCDNKNCINPKKGVRKEILESTYARILQKVSPTKQLIDLTQAIVLDVYHNKIKQIDLSIEKLHLELKGIEDQITSATDKLIGTSNPQVIEVLEKRIGLLSSQKMQLQQTINQLKNPPVDFGTALNTVMSFIENPHKAWSFGNLKQKRVVQKMVFPEPIAIYPRELNGTVNLSLPFKLLKGFEGRKSELVGPLGLEPRTKGL